MTMSLRLWLLLVTMFVSSAVFAAAPPAPAPGASVIHVRLTGAEEVPPVTTSAWGVGVISVAADRTITASVTTNGVAVTVAHIHEGPPGKNGPIIIPLVQTSENVWSLPTDTKLTEGQFESFKAGNLYFNMHSAAYRGGEIRGQIKP